MFFLLRCAFFLSLIYASILSAHGWGEAPLASTGAGKGLLDETARHTMDAAAKLCETHRRECLGDAARLAALIAAAREGAEPAPRPVVASVPLPVPRPRQGAKVTSTP